MSAIGWKAEYCHKAMLNGSNCRNDTISRSDSWLPEERDPMGSWLQSEEFLNTIGRSEMVALFCRTDRNLVVFRSSNLFDEVGQSGPSGCDSTMDRGSVTLEPAVN